MMTYIKLGKVRALFIEIKKDFGTKPFFQKNTFHHETIVDIPYVQIIYTSAQWRPRNKIFQMPSSDVKKIAIRSASNGNCKKGDEQINKNRENSNRIHKY
jgi:hypothetical protein